MNLGHSDEMDFEICCVAVAGKVGEDQGWADLFLVACSFVKGKEVNGAGPAGGGGYVGPPSSPAAS